MQDRIKELAVEAGFNLDPEAGLILDTAGVYSVDDAVRALAKAIARECAEICEADAIDTLRPELELDPAFQNGMHDGAKNLADAIRARFGLASPTGDK